MTGYGCSQDADIEKAARVAEATARADLAARFETRVHAELDSQESTANGKDTQYVRSNISAFSTVKLLGVRVDNFVDRPAKTVHALAVMNVGDAVNMYTQGAARIREEVAALLRSARDAEGRGDGEQAVRTYESTYPHFAELEEMETVLLVIGAGQGESRPGSAVNRAEVTAALERLMARKCDSVDALAMALAHRLVSQIGARSVVVAPFTYRDTEFVSEFSRYLSTLIAAKIAGQKIAACAVTGLQVKSATAPPGTEASLDITGNYVDKGEEIRVFAYAVDPASGDRVGTADTTIPLAVVAKEGLALKPANFLEAMADEKVFGKGDIISGGLSVEAWTSAGYRNLALRSGTRYRILVRVNQPAHVRVIYHLATKQRVLVPIMNEDDYYIDVSKVNMVVELPQQYQVVAPYGAEVIQVLASTKAMPRVPTERRMIDGEPYAILVDALNVALPKLRGIAAVEPSDAREPIAEARVTLTTMP